MEQESAAPALSLIYIEKEKKINQFMLVVFLLLKINKGEKYE